MSDTLLMEKLLEYCNTAYSSAPLCSQDRHCKNCLDVYHYESCPAAYTCETGCHYYVGQFSSRFANEMYYALNHVAQSTDQPLRVLSLGCGPATELCALDCLQRKGVVSSYIYHGVDLNANWASIHAFYTESMGKNVSFAKADALEFIARMDIAQYNVIVLNYFVSNFIKYSQLSSAKYLLQLLQDKMQKAGHFPTIILNDIKTSTMLNFTRLFLQTFSQHNATSKIFFDKVVDKFPLRAPYKGLGFAHYQISGQAKHRKVLAIGATACVHLSSAQVTLQGRAA